MSFARRIDAGAMHNRRQFCSQQRSCALTLDCSPSNHFLLGNKTTSAILRITTTLKSCNCFSSMNLRERPDPSNNGVNWKHLGIQSVESVSEGIKVRKSLSFLGNDGSVSMTGIQGNEQGIALESQRWRKSGGNHGCQRPGAFAND